MTGQNPSKLADSFLSEMPTGVIPVLSSVLPDEAVSQTLRDALDASLQDKQDLLTLESLILKTLHPEMVRLTTELVRKSIREAWLARSQAGA